PALDEFEANDELPADLRKAKEDIIMWSDEVTKVDGRDKAYRGWEPKKFAKVLNEHISMFDNHTVRERIQEYEELVAKLPYDEDQEHV
ncbi:MAG: hypothetical protein LUB61_06110, partial [Eggerthellaceae bacterium]|nr:hypothetical protein [Eggerthellaceae bacterium]